MCAWRPQDATSARSRQGRLYCDEAPVDLTASSEASTRSAPWFDPRVHIGGDAHAPLGRAPRLRDAARARRRRQQGTVLLSVRVSADGHPESIAIAASSGSTSLDAAAVAAVRSWEFEPGRLDGEAVASRVEIPIRFEMR